jgi:hypothetical protein
MRAFCFKFQKCDTCAQGCEFRIFLYVTLYNACVFLCLYPQRGGNPRLGTPNSTSPSSYKCPHCCGTGLPYYIHIRRTGHKSLHVPSADWWVLKTANTAGSNGLICLPKHGGFQDSKFLVTHPLNDQSCLTSTIARRNALTAGPTSYSIQHHQPIIPHC